MLEIQTDLKKVFDEHMSRSEPCELKDKSTQTWQTEKQKEKRIKILEQNI